MIDPLLIGRDSANSATIETIGKCQIRQAFERSDQENSKVRRPDHFSEKRRFFCRESILDKWDCPFVSGGLRRAHPNVSRLSTPENEQQAQADADREHRGGGFGH
jgi:hypothetical protein